MKTKKQTHTPGPWAVGGEHDGDYGSIEIIKEGEYVITHVDKMDCGQERKKLLPFESNACLIASAPELLECVKDALALLELRGGSKATERMRFAIAKAEGRKDQ